MKNSNKKGFTLIELLVVMAVVGVLSGVVMQSLLSARIKSRNTQRIANIDQIAKAMQVATTGTTNQFPSSGNKWSCLGKASCWGTPTLTEWAAVNNAMIDGFPTGTVVPRDPFFVSPQWGDAYVYHSNFPGTKGPGSYLRWIMEGTSNECGRGSFFAGAPHDYGCELYLGPATQ